MSYGKLFDEQFSKMSTGQQRHVRDAIELFSNKHMHPRIRDYLLKTAWAKYRSVSADADLRLHYRILKKDAALFMVVGFHDNYYR